MTVRDLRISALATLFLLAALAVPVLGQITTNNVLLVVNTNSADATAIRDAYLTKYPGVRVWSYAGSTAASISRATFESELRAPLDTYLRSKPAGESQNLYLTIRVLVLTKGVPRRVYDIDGTTIGDNVSLAQTAFSNNNYDAASVDSELTMLHQSLTAGTLPVDGATKNFANNFVANPYYQKTDRIHTFSRQYATTAKNLNFSSGQWVNPTGGATSAKLLSGDFYLVTRLAGYTAADAIAALNRGGTIPVDRYAAAAIFDGDAASTYDGSDFATTHAFLAALRFPSTHDTASALITTSSRPVLAYAGYGYNHTPRAASTYVLTSLTFTPARGAMFNTYESFNCRNFETLSPHDGYGQVADWIHIGGTFGIGNVFEPFTSGVPRNAIFYDRMISRGWTFAEAAYASMQMLSWQTVVVGDPLATYVLLPDITEWKLVQTQGSAGTLSTGLTGEYVESRAQGIRKLTCVLSAPADPTTLNTTNITIVGQRNGSQAARVQSFSLDGAGTTLTIQFSTALPNADRYVITMTSGVKDTSGNSYTGGTTLVISALLGDVNASGEVTGSDLLAVRDRLGLPVTVDTARYDVTGNGTITPADLLAVRGAAGRDLP